MLTIQDRHHELLQRAAAATTDLLDAIVAARKAGARDDLKAAHGLHRKAQWRLDFVAAENSMGFHAPGTRGYHALVMTRACSPCGVLPR